MKKCLPMHEPMLTGQPFMANMLSVISNKSESREWLFETCTQLYCTKNAIRFQPNLYYVAFDVTSCPWIKPYEFSRSLLARKWTSIISFIIDAIDHHSYVYLFANQYYLPPSPIYKQENLNPKQTCHETFIYGYDADTKIFYIADNYNRGKYTHATCTFEEMRLAYERAEEGYWFDAGTGVIMLEWNQNAHYEFDLNNFKNLLINAYESRPVPMSQNYPTVTSEPERAFGLDVYDEVAEYISEFVFEEVDFYPHYLFAKPLHMYWEHHRLSSLKMDYLYDKIKKPILAELMKKQQQLELDALKLRDLALKYVLTRNSKLQPVLLSRLAEMKKSDEEIMYDLINVLEVKTEVNQI